MAGVRTPIGRALRSTQAAWEHSALTGQPVDEVLSEGAVSRRTFIKMSALAAASLALPACVREEPARRAEDEGVVIVGAGLAGVRCAHMLNLRGVQSRIVEASAEPGGRTATLRGFFDGGQLAEMGAEFVSTEHSSIRSLVSELGLELERVDAGSYDGREDVYWIDGRRYSTEEANRDWANAYEAVRSARRSAPWPTLYDDHSAAAERLDRISVPEWIDEEIEGGASSPLGKLMQTTVAAEYGGEPAVLPALALIYTLGWNSRQSLAPLAGTDEADRVAGGNDQLVSGMLEELPDGIVERESVLTALVDNGDGTYTCTFENGSATRDVKASHVVLALPFTALRQVDLTRSGLSELKMRSIRELGMGTNAKLHVQLERRPWLSSGDSGAVYTEPDSFQLAWDETAAEQGDLGILVNFTGGDRSNLWSTPAHGEPPPAMVEQFLSEVEPALPGTTASFNGKAWRDYWVASPWQRGSYAYWGIGQSTTFGGIEAVQEGNIHFAGEHTSIEFGGYMEGAVRSGRRAALEILEA